MIFLHRRVESALKGLGRATVLAQSVATGKNPPNLGKPQFNIRNILLFIALHIYYLKTFVNTMSYLLQIPL